jgi:hypothetical protein|tara:strand:- start:3458 stop:3631 length:174 start_codon:yes stop_codon:yes gene_type:complete
MEFLKNNWLELAIAVMAFAKVIVNLTPTEKDNKIFSWVDSVLDALIPNYTKDGGKHS